ncbi:MAG: hypothetical protein ABSH52_29870 [Terriglobia bacterium]
MIPAVACFRLLRKGARIISGIAGAALVTLLIVNWELVPIFCPKTGEAWMNAPITAVRAPSEGDLRSGRQLGEAVEKGGILATRGNTYLDRTPEWRLETDLENLHAELQRETEEVALLKRLGDTYQQEIEKYRSALMQELSISYHQLDGKVEELTTASQQSNRLVSLYRTLFENEAVSKDTYLQAVETAEMVRSRLAHKHLIPGSANCANRPQSIKHLRRSEGQGFWASESQQAYTPVSAKCAGRCR